MSGKVPNTPAFDTFAIENKHFNITVANALSVNQFVSITVSGRW